jgi:hypothetical protein
MDAERKKISDIDIIPQTECLVVVGHGIERTEAGTWIPSRYIQQTIDGYRTAVKNIDLSPNDPNVLIAGGKIECLATIEAIEILREKPGFPRAIIYAAGRPSYLDRLEPNHPEISEGSVMNEYISRRVNIPDSTEKHILHSDKNTKDDIENALAIALRYGFKHITFIVLEIRIPRCFAFLEKAVEREPKLKDLKVNFVKAEELLGLRYGNFKAASHAWKNIETVVNSSNAYKVTKQNEDIGTAKVRDNEYNRSGNY